MNINNKSKNYFNKVMKLKFQENDVLFAIQSVQYELNKAGETRKPYIKEVAERLNTYDDMAIFYIDKYGYRDKMDILPKGKCNREITKNKGKALEEIKSELHELNENIKQLNKTNELIAYGIFANNITKDPFNRLPEEYDNYIFYMMDKLKKAKNK